MRPLIAISLFFSVNLLALNTAYVSFEHPQGWKCDLTQGVWICQSTSALDRKESLVLSIAATASDWDSLENYENYLNKTRQLETEDGSTVTSSIRYVRNRTINGQAWVDSLQKDSELVGFWTRYLATIHQTDKVKLAVLITYVVSDEYYTKLAPEFDRMVNSLQLNKNFDLKTASDPKKSPFPGNSEIVGDDIEKLKGDLLKERLQPRESPEQPKPPSYIKEILLLLLLIGVILYLRKKRKKKTSPDAG